MIFKVDILQRAQNEIEETYLYYESIQIGLGVKFVIEYENYLNILNTYPFFQNRYDTIRILPLKKFSYSIHFTVDDDNKIVTIHAVTCDYQNPDDYWVFDSDR